LKWAGPSEDRQQIKEATTCKSYFQVRAVYVSRDNAQTTAMLPVLWESKRNQRSLIPVIGSQKVNFCITILVLWSDGLIDLVK
jgi:hypothetical protein